jgi:hypothetical protein
LPGRAGEAVAQLWQAPQGFVVPGSYRKFAELPAVSAHFAGRAGRYGFAAPAAVWCRRGRDYQSQPRLAGQHRWAKPQNRSIFPLRPVAAHAGAFGVASHCRAVSGSFCDGRYNLACGEGEQARKIVGTAQYWRPLAEGRGHVVLAHAVILLDADLSAAHQAANAFEAQLGSGRVYRADKTVTLAQLLPGGAICCPAFARRWRRSWRLS